MKEKTNPDNERWNSNEEYFKEQDDLYEIETEEYFPQETSKPPHY